MPVVATYEVPRLTRHADRNRIISFSSCSNEFVDNWVYGGALAGVVLLLLAPVLTASWPIALTVTYLHQPAYMLHQYEEHDNDRFRHFLNATLGQGREVLSRFAVFIINIPGVWGVIALSLVLAWGVHIGYAADRSLPHPRQRRGARWALGRLSPLQPRAGNSNCHLRSAGGMHVISGASRWRGHSRVPCDRLAQCDCHPRGYRPACSSQASVMP